ncbi:MAG: hypothetical protein WKG03_00940, partial [Telluria sp.]
GGLQTDQSGTPIAPSEYGTLTDAMKETAAYLNWQKDVSIATRMKEEAAVSFNMRAGDGYSKDDLEAFMAGDAEIVTGSLAVVGSFVEFEGKLLIVRKPGMKRGTVGSLVGFNPADLSETELLRMTGAKFIARGSEEWAAAVQRAVALDAAAIGSSKRFEANDLSLYSTSVADVRDALDMPIPSQEMSLDSFQFRAPFFPFALEQGATGGPLIDKIKAEQAPMIKRYSERYMQVELTDLRNVGTGSYANEETKMKALAVFAIAHKMRATAADLSGLKRGLTLGRAMLVLGTTGDFMAALPGAVASVKTHDELDAWALAWLNTEQPALEVDSLESALGHQWLNYTKARNKIDDGVERWHLFPESNKYSISTAVNASLTEAFGKGVLAAEINAQSGYSMGYDFMAEHGRKVVDLLFAEVGEYVELKVGVVEARSLQGLPASARMHVQTMDSATQLASYFMGNMWSQARRLAAGHKATVALDTAGIDADGMLKALRRVPGVVSAVMGTVDDLKAADKYSASYFYKANEYLLLKTTRGTPTHEKIATAGATGLQGRTFDNVTKAFRLTIKDGEKFSDDKLVASVASLFAHLGLNISDYVL